MLGRKTAYTDPDMGDWAYGYDENGNLTYQRDAMDQVLRFQYDELNRPTVKKHDDIVVTSYTYTLTGHPWVVSHPLGADTYSYDERDRVTGTTRSISGFGSKSVSMSYDSMGRLSTETYPDGEVVEYSYNGGGNLETAGGASSYVANVDDDANCKVTQLGFGNGKTTGFAYDPLSGRLTDIEQRGWWTFTTSTTRWANPCQG